MTDPTPPGRPTGLDDRTIRPSDVVDRITRRAFEQWYRRREFERNILEGREYFNGPTPSKPPDRFTPSGLLSCHRKATYRRQNAPREGLPPRGLYWTGRRFETDLVVPFLRDISPTGAFVRRSLWIDTTVELDGEEVRLRGATDPVITDANGTPIVVTEVKFTRSVEKLTTPRAHHLSQLHVYLYGLRGDQSGSSVDGLLLYGSREELELRPFPVEFDRSFWTDRVLPWIEAQRAFELEGELPPPAPEFEWECEYCQYRHRCGKADTPYRDSGPEGLLPMFSGYAREPLVNYLEAHEDHDAKLTPTLAHRFPGLTDQFDVYPWRCPRCTGEFAWNRIEWDGATDRPPACPSCTSDEILVLLAGPDPEDQFH